MKSRLEQALEKYERLTEEQTKEKHEMVYSSYWNRNTRSGKMIKYKKKVTIRPGLPKSTIVNLSKWDPSGNNKYLDWMIKTRMSIKIKNHQITKFVNLFHKFPHRFKHKDIHRYKTGQEIYSDLISAQNGKSLKEVKKEGSELIYSCDDYKILRITSWQASVIYGYNTKWCICSDQSDYHFHSYGEDYCFDFILFKNDEKMAIIVRKTDYTISSAHFFFDEPEERICCFLANDDEIGLAAVSKKYNKDMIIKCVKASKLSDEDDVLAEYNLL